MAFISCQINSDVLEQRIDVDFILPFDSPLEKGREINGVLYLLHGLGGSQRDWQDYSAIGRYAIDNGLAVVMPYCPQSFYVDMVYGGPFYTYMTEELPSLLQKLFHLPTEREKTFVAGLSMGGYGATLLGLSRPDMFGAFAEFSGATQLEKFTTLKDNAYVKKFAAPAFGENIVIPDKYNLFKLAEKTAKLPQKELPRIFMACGKQDNYGGFALYEQNVALYQHIAKLPYEAKWMEWDGIHEFNFWDRAIVHAIAFFLKNDYDQQKLKDWQ